MRTTANLARRLLFLLLAGSLLLGSLGTAQASSLDSFISTYQDIEKYAPPGSLPVSSQDLIAAKSLFGCLEQGSNAGICIDTFSHTPLGQQVVKESGLPTSFWSLLDAYVAYKNGDYWGVAYSLGEAVVCAVLQVLTGGADICGLIKELVALAESLWDAATAVAEFFADLGEGAWEAAKGAYCATLGGLFGGCDDEGASSPPEVIAYSWIFAPKLADGVTARKAVSPTAFETLRTQLTSNALHQPAIWSIALPGCNESQQPGIPGSVFGGGSSTFMCPQINFTPGQVDTAKKIFTTTVDTQWVADIVSPTGALFQLGQQRKSYNNPQQIATSATAATAAFKNSKTSPAQTVTNQCGDYFRTTQKFAHIDRWILFPPPVDPKPAAVKAQSSTTWCSNSFFAGNAKEFAKHFRAFVKSTYCPELGSVMTCPTIEKYENCVTVMGSVGEEKQCGVNTATIAKEAAEKVKKALVDKGSKGSYTIVPPTGPISNKPADLICQRPPQQHACTEEAQKLFGAYPVKLVNCTVTEPADYTALHVAVAQAVALLNGVKSFGQYQVQTSFGNANFGVDPVDPLLVRTNSADAFTKAQNENKSYGFKPPSTQPGFLFQLFKQNQTVDGLDTPTISAGKELNLKPPLTKEDMKKKLDPKHQGDPIDQLKDAAKTKVSPEAVQSGLEKTGPAAKAPTATLAKTGAGAMTAATQAAAAGPAMGAGQQQQAMSGKLPEGKGTPKTSALTEKVVAPVIAGATSAAAAAVSAKGAGVAAPAPAPPPKDAKPVATVAAANPAALLLPDLTAAPEVTIVGRKASWPTPVVLEAKDAPRSANGVCQFPVQYGVRNNGTTASGSFTTVWSSSMQRGMTVDRNWLPLAAGATGSQTDTLGLKPGLNQLTLEIDQKQQVKEGNEGNNLFKLQVTVNGPCGASTLTLPGRR